MPAIETRIEPAEGRFVQGLGLLDSTMIVAGSMIGSGIFIVSADISRQVGSAGWLLVVLLLTWSNSTGLRAGKMVQNIFTVTKIAALLGLVLLGLIVGANLTATDANFKDAWTASFTQPVARGAKEFTTAPLGGLSLLL